MLKLLLLYFAIVLALCLCTLLTQRLAAVYRFRQDQKKYVLRLINHQRGRT